MSRDKKRNIRADGSGHLFEFRIGKATAEPAVGRAHGGRRVAAAAAESGGGGDPLLQTHRDGGGLACRRQHSENTAGGEVVFVGGKRRVGAFGHDGDAGLIGLLKGACQRIGERHAAHQGQNVVKAVGAAGADAQIQIDLGAGGLAKGHRRGHGTR